MDSRFRLVLAVTVMFQALLALGFLFQVPLITSLWPLDGATALSFVFIGSMAAAAVASLAWCLIVGEQGAIVGVGLDYVAVFGPLALIAFLAGGSLGPVLPSSMINVAFGLVLVAIAGRTPIRDPRPMPTLVRAAFMVFVPILVAVGGALIAGVPDVLPWQVSGDTAFVFGFYFLGAAAYFAYGLWRPSWHNAGGQLVGFLIYDLVLLWPLGSRLPAGEARFQVSLVLYVAVLLISAVIASWYLFLDRRTGIRSYRREPRLADEPVVA